MSKITKEQRIESFEGDCKIMTYWKDLNEQKVTYSIEMNGKIFVIENVPARINPEIGEQFFSPSTVEKLQQIIFNQEEPVRFVETPVYNFAAGATD